MAIHYHSIPNMVQFQKDSAVTLAMRSSDKMLQLIERQLWEYHIGHTTQEERVEDLANLITLCRKWHQFSRQGFSGVHPGRQEAIAALYTVAVQTLATTLKIGIQQSVLFASTFSEDGAKRAYEMIAPPQQSGSSAPKWQMAQIPR